MKSRLNSRFAIVGAAFAALAIACSDSSAPISYPLEGLAQVNTNDSGFSPPPDPTPGPGSFHGVVRGYKSGFGDTLSAAEPLVGLRVTAYARGTPTSTDTVGVGPQVASVLTNGSGVFQLPDLPGGEYVVTFKPPEGSKYRGGWSVGIANATSNVSPWWIMLPEK